ncbi:ABC transporter permease [Conexibacter woesei]|uniref:Binding-protein-dependent transport systems inner membrane component n=1 Tax=Conexibacter woesei (strain DSM 14684 / CCUG 47730 / CIP 108061 / JCM 11494 / NBRC 100937 / ID131577) TaxID=469383 RepID=D3F7I3_CONWI|nr:ABC transporter permease [Conexibacter woesei]ADB50845.1 binding-protein-dependent transport systems inner membrane component [Conexibacter woesei DSM 14684]
MSAVSTPRPEAAASGGAGRAGRRRRRSGVVDKPRWLALVTGATLLFLSAPLVVIAVFSFNSSSSLSDFDKPSLRWYQTLAENDGIQESLVTSLTIAGATTLLALALGTGLAFAFTRGKKRVTRPIQATTLMTLVTPEIATAIGLLTLFTTMGVPLSTTTLILGHVTFALVYVTVIVGGRLQLLSRDLEEAGMDLGATELQTFRLVVLPQLAPALAGAGLLVFVLSFDDFVTSLFLSGTEVAPLPVRIYGMLRFGLTPEVNAIGTLMMVASVGLGVVGLWAVNRRGRRRFSVTDSHTTV